MRDKYQFQIHQDETQITDYKQIQSQLHEFDQNNVISCIKYIVEERKIQFKFIHDEKAVNNRIHLQFNNFYFADMILKSFDNIFIEFNHCKIGNLYFPYGQPNFRDNFSFSGTLIQVFSYSEYDLQSLDLFSQYGEMQANLLILPAQIIDMKIKSVIKKIQFQSYNYLESIDLECQPQIFCGDDYKNNQVMNLQKFTKLIRIKIINVRKDILLPNELESLYLQSGSKNKILNTRLSSHQMVICKFDLLNVQVLQYKELNFQHNVIKNLFLCQNQDLKYIDYNKIENLFVDSQYDEINLNDNKIKNLVLRNNNIKILNIKGCVSIYVDNNLADDRQPVLKQENQIANANSLDFRNFLMLNEIFLDTSSNFLSSLQYLQCPIQLQSISLKLTYHSKPQISTTFDFSYLVNLRNIEIMRFNIQSVILCQSKLKFEFKLNSKYNTMFQIKQLPIFQQESCLFNQFVNNLGELQIDGLDNLIIKDSLINNLDFQVFKNLKVLKLGNIEKQVLLPNTIEQFNLKNNDMSQFMHNYDFSEFEMLRNVSLQYCNINSLIAQPNVQCRIFLSTVNFSCIQFTERQNCLYNSIYNPTKIKTFEQQRQQSIIVLKPWFDFTVEILVIHEPQILKQLTICGLQQLIVKDCKNSNILNFTNFISLSEINLSNINCTGIIFGHAQKQIKILQYKYYQKIQFIDFRNCQNNYENQPFKMDSCNIGTLYLGNHHIQHRICNFDYVQFSQNLAYPNLQDYNKATKFAITFI